MDMLLRISPRTFFGLLSLVFTTSGCYFVYIAHSLGFCPWCSPQVDVTSYITSHILWAFVLGVHHKWMLLRISPRTFFGLLSLVFTTSGCYFVYHLAHSLGFCPWCSPQVDVTSYITSHILWAFVLGVHHKWMLLRISPRTFFGLLSLVFTTSGCYFVYHLAHSLGFCPWCSPQVDVTSYITSHILWAFVLGVHHKWMLLRISPRTFFGLLSLVFTTSGCYFVYHLAHSLGFCPWCSPQVDVTSYITSHILWAFVLGVHHKWMLLRISPRTFFGLLSLVFTTSGCYFVYHLAHSLGFCPWCSPQVDVTSYITSHILWAFVLGVHHKWMLLRISPRTFFGLLSLVFTTSGCYGVVWFEVRPHSVF